MKKAINFLHSLGFKVLGESPDTVNGPDFWVKKGRRVYTVEFKKARKLSGNNFQVRTVEKNRINDDFILIELPRDYFLFEPMSHHISNCSPKGTRNLHGYG